MTKAVPQCSSCGGFCSKKGCERENVKPTQIDPRLAACVSALRACRETFIHYNERQLGIESTNIRMIGVCEDAIAKALDGSTTPGELYLLTTDRAAAVSTEATFYPMGSCPRNAKVLLLGAGGVATVAEFNGRDPFWQGWHPLPRRAR